jgi:transposase
VAVGPGDEHDSVRFIEVLERIRLRRGVGRPRRRPKELYADSAYDSARIRRYLRSRGIRANIPSNARNRHKPKRGRPYRFDEEGYRRVRSSVERFFAWLKSFKRITIRYERLATTFLALIHIACILIYLRVLQ